MIAWALCFQYFVAELTARSGWTLPHSARFDHISDLGAVQCVTTGPDPVCSPLHAVMNGAFVLQGVLIVTGAAFGRASLPAGRSVVLARVLNPTASAPSSGSPRIRFRSGSLSRA